MKSKDLLVLVAFISLCLIVIGIAKDCYTPEEAQDQADKYVADYNACAGPVDDDCTSAYRIAEDENRACWKECYDNNPDGPSIASCREGCDSVLAQAQDVYNSCISDGEDKCRQKAEGDYRPLTPVCRG